MNEIIESIAAVWAIVTGVIGGVVYKIVPELKTRIQRCQYNNSEGTFSLVEYELIYIFIALAGALIGTASFGEKSTWELIYVPELTKMLLILGILYIIGIIFVVKYKMSKEYRSFMCYLKNIFWGGLAYLVLSALVCLESVAHFSHMIELAFLLYMIVIFCAQILTNISAETINKVKYMIYTADNSCYASDRQPVKKGKFYCLIIQASDGKCKQQILIPEQDIKRIEVEIQYFDQNDKGCR